MWATKSFLAIALFAIQFLACGHGVYSTQTSGAGSALRGIRRKGWIQNASPPAGDNGGGKVEVSTNSTLKKGTITLLQPQPELFDCLAPTPQQDAASEKCKAAPAATPSDATSKFASPPLIGKRSLNLGNAQAIPASKCYYICYQPEGRKEGPIAVAVMPTGLNLNGLGAFLPFNGWPDDSGQVPGGSVPAFLVCPSLPPYGNSNLDGELSIWKGTVQPRLLATEVPNTTPFAVLRPPHYWNVR